MTSGNSTLFAQILPMFTGQTERVATEALRHILAQSESARAALEQMLRAEGVEIGSLTQFATEAIGEEGERVDLVCYDDSSTERVLIEAKFWAGLTDNQPNTYLARLPEEGQSVLLFVAPAQRTETLWPVLVARAQEQHEMNILTDSGDTRIAATDGINRRMAVTSWRAVLDQIESRATIEGDVATLGDVNQLRGLTERMDTDAFLPVHSDELGEKIPRRIISYANLVHDAAQRAVGQGWADASGLRITPQWYGDGRYIRIHGVMVWFGINLQQWSGHGQAPLWLQTQDNNEWYPIAVPTGVEHSEVLDFVVEQLDTIGKHLQAERGEQ